MPLAFHRARSDTPEWWSDHWGKEDPPVLVRSLRTSPLTDLLRRNLPRRGAVLEAGCGTGAFVVLLRQERFDIEGVDFSPAAVDLCRRHYPEAPVRIGDVRRLDVPDGHYAAVVSLGVVEHFEEGPDAILREARRVLAPGGTLLISVPFINAMRAWNAGKFRREQEALRAAGAAFYQYGFTRGEVERFLGRNGFVVERFHPYDPARMFRKYDTKAAAAPAEGGAARPSPLRRLARRLLYTRPLLWGLSHMILAVARRD